MLLTCYSHVTRTHAHAHTHTHTHTHVNAHARPTRFIFTTDHVLSFSFSYKYHFYLRVVISCAERCEHLYIQNICRRCTYGTQWLKCTLCAFLKHLAKLFQTSLNQYPPHPRGPIGQMCTGNIQQNVPCEHHHNFTCPRTMPTHVHPQHYYHIVRHALTLVHFVRWAVIYCRKQVRNTKVALLSI